MTAALLAALWISARAEPGTGTEESQATLCEGVYSSAQALSGQKIFAAQCSQCHGANFRGGFGVASLAGPAFKIRWGDKTLLTLFDRMKTTMPLDNPGKLSDQGYIEILARILEVNSYPANVVAELPLQREAPERLTLPKKCP